MEGKTSSDPEVAPPAIDINNRHKNHFRQDINQYIYSTGLYFPKAKFHCIFYYLMQIHDKKIKSTPLQFGY